MIKLFFLLFILVTFSKSAYSQESLAKQRPLSFDTTIALEIKLNYLLYLPVDYGKKDTNYPLMLFLHGAGERGNDINLVKKNGPPKLIEEGKDFPFLIVSPQCPENQRWNPLALNFLLDDIIKNYKVDTNKIYITGLSMGGHGTLELAKFAPERFAAIAPICGWSDMFEIHKLKNMPIWVIHGAKDALVPISESERLVNILKYLGNDVKFTVYPEAGHDAWTETYNNQELYNWLLEQSLEKKK